MKSKLLFLVSGLGWVLAACENASRVTLPSDQAIIEKKTTASYHPKEQYFLGQVQVMTADDSALVGVLDDLKTKQGVSASVIDRVPGHPIYLLEISSLTTVDETIKTLKADPRVAMAARNHRISLSNYRTNDAQFAAQWSLSNQGQDAPGSLAGRPGADIGMDDASTEGSYDVVVGVIDTGIDYNHEDLSITEEVDGRKVIQAGSNIWTNPGEIPGNAVNDDNNGDPKNGLDYVDDVHGYNFVGRNGDPMDDQGHGTHVSGTIGALRNNLKGVSGVVKKVSLMGLKFLDGGGSGGDFDAQLAIYYAIDMQKRFPQKKFILQNSWGAGSRSAKTGDDDDFLMFAFDDASRAGLLSVVAAGNDGTSNRFDPHYPANYSKKLSGFLTVAATNNLDQLASFSSYGFDVVQVAAPGTMILSSIPEYLYGTGYAAWSGTSMATPHVSGVAAAVWAAHPELTADEVKKRIENTVDVLPQLHGAISTSGRVNVKRAVAGDVNIALPKIYEEIATVITSPKGDDRSTFESMTELKAEGAKEVSVCFERVNLDDGQDWIEVMGADYRVRDMMTGRYEARKMEVCTAPVLGDTVYLRLVKASKSGSQGFETKYLKVMR